MGVAGAGTGKARSASRWRSRIPPRGESLVSPRWRFLVSPRWLAWHAFAVVAFWGMRWLGDRQFHRAIAGNSLSWACTFEWPIFAIMGAAFWAKTIRDEHRISSDAVTEAAALTGAGLPRTAVGGPGAAGGPEDQERATYDAYLARLNEQVKGHGRWHGLR